MTPAHPGGEAMTRHLLELAGVSAETRKEGPVLGRALDLGAGEGGTVRLLKALGWQAEGLDLEAAGCGLIRKGDMLNTPYDDEAFDLIVSECAFFVTGDQAGAIREAARLLKRGGTLAFGDVFFGEPDSVAAIAEDAGLQLSALKDLTAVWRDYYITLVWEGRIDPDRYSCRLSGSACRYYLAAARKA